MKFFIQVRLEFRNSNQSNKFNPAPGKQFQENKFTLKFYNGKKLQIVQ